ncbi:MAG: hypothetical protein Q8M07_15545, partial [Prosthecobacter sp.]|nr:hypothetical protein [Prosthecobacter sp.]
KQRREEIRRQERENPADMDERVDQAYRKALLHGMKMISRNTLFNHATNGMSPETKERFEKMVEENALQYLMAPHSPGFADPVEDDPEDEEADSVGKGSHPASPTESDSIRPDPTSFSEAA